MRNFKTLLLTLVLIILSYASYSQKYFQQEVNYKIDVKLNDKTNSLKAFEEIEYINNSPDELEFIYFHLWPNAYKNGHTALAKQKLETSPYRWFENKNLIGYIDSLNFIINGEPAEWEYDNNHIDICKLYLNQPLPPGAKITITTPFYVKLPSCFISRLGHGNQSYQITQWYPKPAVYDHHGWHPMPYLNQGEFYSEFGSFDISITLPKNYVVGATGDLLTPEEIEWLNEKAKQTAQIKKYEKSDYPIPQSDTAFKTIRYTQKNVHDFAWFADKRFHVLKGKREMPNTGKKVTLWAMFLNRDANSWQKSIEYIGDALYYYSFWYGDYPYNNCTAVHSSISAGGGMEYPNITVIGNSGKDLSLEMVIMHEVGHNWFYGMLGFNERDFPWMDEGINSFSEARYMKKKYEGTAKLYKMAMNEKQANLLNIDHLSYQAMHRLSYLMSARYNIDQPANLHSAEYTFSNYGQIIYHKVSLMFDHLLAYLGDEEFNAIMRDFFEQWKYKHPYPEDIRRTFEEKSGKDLSWLFNDLLATSKKLDYKICGLKNNQLKVKNTGLINAPFPVTAFKDEEKLFTQWYEGFEDKKTLTLPQNKDFDYLIIDPDYRMPEIYTHNNYIRKKGLFRKTEPLDINLIGVVENTKYTNINIFPAMGINQYNKYMLGMLFYNSFVPRNKFEYQLIPMYSFGNNNLAGYGNLEYHILPYESVFREITLGLSGKRYAFSSASDDNFHQLKAEINFHLRKKNPKSKIKNNISLSTTIADNVNDIIMNTNPELETFIQVSYNHQNNSYNPYKLEVAGQYHQDFLKANTEFNYQFNYMRGSEINIRLFGGAYLYTSKNYLSVYNYGLSSLSGTADYTYDHLFLGRFEDPAGSNFLGKQYVTGDGGFITHAPHFTTSDWILSLNTSLAIPFLPSILDFHLYGNLATYGTPDNFQGYDNSSSIAWECGIIYKFPGEIITVSLPLFMSEQLNIYSDDIYGKYYERIRFSLDLSIFNVFNLAETALP